MVCPYKKTDCRNEAVQSPIQQCWYYFIDQCEEESMYKPNDKRRKLLQ